MATALLPQHEICSEAQSNSTADHPDNVASLLTSPEFVLVTSAVHMPRAVACFRSAGLDPIPYPVDRLSRGNYRWNDWLPSFESLWKLNVAWREYLAVLLYNLRGCDTR